jgi:hypothetical protein
VNLVPLYRICVVRSLLDDRLPSCYARLIVHDSSRLVLAAKMVQKFLTGHCFSVHESWTVSVFPL